MNSKIGPGSLSIPIFFLAVIFYIKLGRTVCLGEIFLNAIGISRYSRLHNKLFISLILLIAGFLLGVIFKKNEGAIFGKNICMIFGATLIIFLIAGYGFGVDLFYPFYSSPE